MKERHSSIDVLVDQLNDIHNLPKTKQELESILKSKGFKS